MFILVSWKLKKSKKTKRIYKKDKDKLEMIWI